MIKPEQQLGYDAVIKALKTHSQLIPGITDEEVKAGYEVFKKETDRGAAILLATSVEDRIAELLQSKMSHLNSDERTRIFGWDGPLGTFSAKVRMAHALGYLDRHMFKLVEVIREMRNACAHSRQDISFKDPALGNAVLLMMRMSGGKFHKNDDDPALLRMYFLMLTSWITYCISTDDKKPTLGAFIVDAAERAGVMPRTSERKPRGRSSPEDRGNRKGP